MDEESIIVVDPRGRVVHLPLTLYPDVRLNESQVYLDGLQKAIQAPACMIEMSSGELFYFRSIGWSITVLIRAVLQDGLWRATECIENPDPEFIQDRLKEGTFIAGSSMG